jgi:Mn-dependent DtxR family transcriptional regulator
MLSTNKKFLRDYLTFVSDLTTVLGNKIKYHIGKSLRESIINYLKQESNTQNSLTVGLKGSKKMLAERFGVQRTSLSRELKKMQNDGLITFDKKSITIIDESILSL